MLKIISASANSVDGSTPRLRNRNPRKIASDEADLHQDSFDIDSSSSSHYSRDDSELQGDASVTECNSASGSPPKRLYPSLEGFKPMENEFNEECDQYRGSPVLTRKKLHSDRGQDKVSPTQITLSYDKKVSQYSHHITTSERNRRDSPKKDEVDGDRQLNTIPETGFPHWLKAVGLVIGLFIIMFIMCCFSYCTKSTDSNGLTYPTTNSSQQLSEAFKNIKDAFPKQSHNFWNVLGAGTRSIMNSKEPERPAVFIVVVPSDASDTADCLLRNFLSMITKLFNPRRPAVEFSPDNVDALTPEEIKHQLDDVLNEGLSSGSRVAVVHHLERLPGKSAGMLHSFCDDSNAPFRSVIYVLMLHVNELTSVVTESDTFVRDRLKTLWGDQLGSNRFDPLLSRIASLNAFVRPESSDVLKKNLC